MPDLRHAGFFHLDEECQGHPVYLLEEALLKSGLEAVFPQSLVVLPEAFNIIEGYYFQHNSSDSSKKCAADGAVEKRLTALSGKLGLCFVVGLIRDDSSRYSEAILIDGNVRKVLSQKIRRDGSHCYAPFMELPKDCIIPHRGLNIGALICMDAAAGDGKESLEKQQARHANILEEFGKHAGTKLLCIPARFGTSSPVDVAKNWNHKRLSILIANRGNFRFPSVLHFEDGQVCVAPANGDCHVHLGALPSPKQPSPAPG